MVSWQAARALVLSALVVWSVQTLWAGVLGVPAGGSGAAREVAEGAAAPPPVVLSGDAPAAGAGDLVPEVGWWLAQGDALVDATVFTRDAEALHAWQAEEGLLIDQSAADVGTLVWRGLPEAGELVTRPITMPARLGPKALGVPGTVAVTRDLPMAEPASGPAVAWSTALEGAAGAHGVVDEGDAEPNTWFSKDIHGVTDAWALGVNGTGVRVAVADSGVDFAHPDLNGTQAREADLSSPWYGWPIAFDAWSLNRWLATGASYPSNNNSWYVNTSATDSDANNDSILDTSGINISGIRPSVSGTYHLGEHPDINLRIRNGGAGVDVPVVLVDSTTAGVYDTVYVDTDTDDGLADEQPMSRGSETGGQDLTGDGQWDRSAGMIYFIADGNTSLPYAPTLAPRNGYADRIPAAGELVAFMINSASGVGGNHGTKCASAVVAQGRVGTGDVEGMAPGATVVAVANHYMGYIYDSWRFISEGYDGRPGTADDIQLGSFSFGYSAIVGSGIDYGSLYLDWLTRVHSPTTSYLVAAGNGGHGYGTVASPGGAHGVITIGAATSHPNEASGETWGQSTAWSARGPNSVGRMDPDLIAVGESATGDITLNQVTNANSAVSTWSGTSLATPLSAGLTAVVLQAWRGEHGAWPDSQVLRDLLMSTADDTDNDPIVQGAGWLNASRAVDAVQGRDGGWWMEPASWMPGQLDGAHRVANLNHLSPGGTASLDVTVHNPTNQSVALDLTPEHLVPVAHRAYTWNSSTSNGWDGYQSSRPDIVYPLIIKNDANNSTVPQNTTLLRARAAMHALGFDGDQNHREENRIHLSLLRWNDTDGDGLWWNDTNNDSHVDSGEWEEANEFSWVTYNFKVGPQVETRLGDPWADDGDGLLLGVYRRNVRTDIADPIPIQVDITAFEMQPDPWLTAPANVTLSANSNATVTVDVSVPPDALPGITLHAVGIDDGAGRDWRLPIVLTTSASGPFTLTPRTIDGNVSNQSLYDATWMQGAQRWGWRARSGDWKALTIDWPANLSSDGGIIIKADWPENGHTDIDLHWFSENVHPFTTDAPAAYGPHGLGYELGSVNMYRGGGIWGHQTSTGGSAELLMVAATPGTKQLLLHNVMHGVETNDLPVNLSVGMAAPLDGGVLDERSSVWDAVGATRTVHIGSTMALDVVGADAWGWSQPVWRPTETVWQNTAGTINTSNWTYGFQTSGAQRIQVDIDANEPDQDLDLYVYHDADGDGVIDWTSEREAGSGNWDSRESVMIDSPADGLWWVVVHGYNVPNGSTTFWMELEVPEGDGLEVTNLTALNASEIASQWGGGAAALGGQVPVQAWAVEIDLGRPNASGVWNGSLELDLASGGSIPFEWGFDLVDPEPFVGFSEPVNGSSYNHAVPIALWVADLGSGLDLADVLIWLANGTWQLPSNLSLKARGPFEVPLNGSRLLDAWLVVQGLANASAGAVLENETLLSDTVVRRAWFNWTSGPEVGWHDWWAQVTDREGRQNATRMSVGLDATPPPISFEAPTAAELIATNASRIVLHVATEPGASLFLDGQSVPVGASGLATVSVDLDTDGLRTLLWSARDAAGNWAHREQRVLRDATPPELAAERVPVAWLNATTWTVRVEAWDVGGLVDEPNWSVSAGAGDVTLALLDATGTALLGNLSGGCPQAVDVWCVEAGTNASLRAAANVSLAEGEQRLTWLATDRLGNSNGTSVVLRVDRGAPVISWPWVYDSTVLAPVDDATVGLADEWSASLTARVSVDGTAPVTSQRAPGDWPLDLATLGAGPHEICVDVEDLAGNIAVGCRHIVVDASGLEPAIEAPWNGTRLRDSTVPLRIWTAPGQPWSVEVDRGGAWASHTQRLGEDSWHLIDLELIEGVNRFRVEADVLGEARVWLLEVERDTLPPTLTHLTPVDGWVTSSDQLVITAQSEANQSASLHWRLADGTQGVEQVRAGALGVLVATLPLNGLADGVINWTWTVEDALGNTASAAATVERDTSPPTAGLRLVSNEDGVRASCGLSEETAAWSLVISREGGRVAEVSGTRVDLAECTWSSSDPAEGNWSVDLVASDGLANTAAWTARTIVEAEAPVKAGDRVAAGDRPLRQVDLALLGGLAVLVLLLTGMVLWGGRRRRGASASPSDRTAVGAQWDAPATMPPSPLMVPHAPATPPGAPGGWGAPPADPDSADPYAADPDSASPSDRTAVGAQWDAPATMPPSPLMVPHAPATPPGAPGGWGAPPADPDSADPYAADPDSASPLDRTAVGAQWDAPATMPPSR